MQQMTRTSLSIFKDDATAFNNQKKLLLKAKEF